MSLAPEDDDERTVVHLSSGQGARAEAGVQLGHTLPPGTRIRDYEITGLIGEGGFGIVYLAYDHSLQRRVAVKEYMPSSMASRVSASAKIVVKSDRHKETFKAGLKSFVNEARLLARFDHPALVKVYRFWEENGTAYMVMPYYEGPTLKSALAARREVPDEGALRAWLRPLLDALAVMHAAQCYHRDIAPDNILLTPTGPLLLDFGAARRVIGDMTHALTVVLKPGYAPIEQYGDVATMSQGAWTDLYALACVVYFAITGKVPMSSVERLMDDRLEPLSRLAAGRYSAGFLSAIDAALAVRPQDRPQTDAQFRAMLGEPVVAPAAPAFRTPVPTPVVTPAASTQAQTPTSTPPTQAQTPPAAKAPPPTPLQTALRTALPTQAQTQPAARAPTPTPTPLPTQAQTLPAGNTPAPAPTQIPVAWTRTPPPLPTPSPSPSPSPQDDVPTRIVTVRRGAPPLATPPPADTSRVVAAVERRTTGPGAMPTIPAALPIEPARLETAPAALESKPSAAAQTLAPALGPLRSEPRLASSRVPLYIAGAAVCMIAAAAAGLNFYQRRPATESQASGTTSPPAAQSVASTPVPVAAAPVPPAPASALAPPLVIETPATETPANKTEATVAPANEPLPEQKPLPRPRREAQLHDPGTRVEPVPRPALERPLPGRGAGVQARCSDILQKASLEPLTDEEAAFLRRECR